MAANVPAICNSFKTDLLNGYHAFSAAYRAADAFKAALYLINQSIGAATAAYSATGEASGTGYTAGGAAVTNASAPALSGSTACWTPSGSLVWAGLTLASAFDTVLIYNSTQANKAVSSHNFGPQTITAGTFTLTMPGNTAGNALVQLA
jgi:hypothetical protein